MIESIDGGWGAPIAAHMGQVDRENLEAFLAQAWSDETSVYPCREHVFRAFDLTPVSEVKAVILGQDPYPKRGQACGLAFDFEGDGRRPHSLNCIVAELRRDKVAIGNRLVPKNARLSRWADRGVLLLNTALTVTADDAGSHPKVWAPFTEAVLRVLAERPKVVFLLWGTAACAWAPKLGLGPERVVWSDHPAARRKKAEPEAGSGAPDWRRPFKGSHPFSAANEKFRLLGAREIDWRL